MLNVSGTEICLRFLVVPAELGPIDRASLSLRKRGQNPVSETLFLNKKKRRWIMSGILIVILIYHRLDIIYGNETSFPITWLRNFSRMTTLHRVSYVTNQLHINNNNNNFIYIIIIIIYIIILFL
jgi:hypothetical protein